jgi:hypothetical protein
MKRTTLDELGRIAWDSYCKAVGGKAFNGDVLPTWAEMKVDTKKAHLVKAWIAAGTAVQERVLKDSKLETKPAPVSSAKAAVTPFPEAIKHLDRPTGCCGSKALLRGTGHYACPCGGTVIPFKF